MISDKSVYLRELLYVSYREMPLQGVLKNIFDFLSVHMPVSYFGIYNFFSGVITRIAIYPQYENQFLSPETFQIPDELLRAAYQDTENYGTWKCCRSCQTKGERPYAKIAKMLHPMGGTNIYMPLDFWINCTQFRFISVHCTSECSYSQEQVDLCEEIREPLSAALREILDREKEARPRMHGAFPRRDESQGQAQSFHSLDEHIAQYIRQVIQYTNGRISGKNGAASILGMPSTTLWSKMRKLKINSGRL